MRRIYIGLLGCAIIFCFLSCEPRGNEPSDPLEGYKVLNYRGLIDVDSSGIVQWDYRIVHDTTKNRTAFCSWNFYADDDEGNEYHIVINEIVVSGRVDGLPSGFYDGVGVNDTSVCLSIFMGMSQKWDDGQYWYFPADQRKEGSMRVSALGQNRYWFEFRFTELQSEKYYIQFEDSIPSKVYNGRIILDGDSIAYPNHLSRE